jgi:hypothetical protein
MATLASTLPINEYGASDRSRNASWLAIAMSASDARHSAVAHGPLRQQNGFLTGVRL